MLAGEVIKLVIAGGGAVTGLVTLTKGLAEYRLQGRQKRADQFFALRASLKNEPVFAELAEQLEHSISSDSELTVEAAAKLEATPFRVKRDYLGLFEEVALALNSGLIKPEVAHYMFGYYAILCYQNDSFWNNVDRSSPYWSLFAAFYREMKVQQERLLDRSTPVKELRV